MPALDFCEIAAANVSDGQQDQFEHFARDVLTVMGLTVTEGPDRGPDGGRDLIATEQQKGPLSAHETVWLVSCKHYAHSGASVGVDGEHDVLDRIHAHGANAFLGFYSTIPSSGLSGKLEGLGRDSGLRWEVLDGESIEKELLASVDGQAVAKRYLPVSFGKWFEADRRPSLLFGAYRPLPCVACGRDLLQPPVEGNMVFLVPTGGGLDATYEGVYCCCKRPCGRELDDRDRYRGMYSTWEDLGDLSIPGRYL